MTKLGRPTKFTPATVRRILRCVGKGMPLTHAANASGVSFHSLNTYRNTHPEFADQLAKAISKAVEMRLEVIEQALDSQDESIRLRSAQWYLEHVHPEAFARNRIEVTGADGAPLAGAVAIYLPRKDGDANGAPTVTVNARKEIENGR